MQNKTLTYELKIRALIEEAQRDLEGFKKSLNSTWQSGEPPKHMLKSYETLRTYLESLKQIAAKGMVDTSDLRQAEQDCNSLKKGIHNLTVEFGLFTTEQKKAMLSTEEQANLKARAKAVEEYTDSLKKNEEVIKKRKPLESERATIQEKQKPKRALVETSAKDASERLQKLKQAGGPILPMSADAKAYEQTLEKQAQLLKDIEFTQKQINTLKGRGLKEDGNNQLTKARVELEALLKQQEVFNNMAGKTEYDTAMEKYNQEVSNLEQIISSSADTLKELDNEFEEVDKKLSKLSVKDTTKEFDDLKDRLKELGVEGIEGAKSIEEITEAVKSLENKALKKVDKSLTETQKNLRAMGGEAEELKKQIDTGTESIKQQNKVLEQKQAFENKIKQFLGMAGAAQVMRSALRNAMATIKELDATMTEMSVVTDLSVGDYWEQLPQYTKRANELGLAINDVYKADTLFYQQGLKTNEVVAISTETMKMARIAGLDTAEATDRMTAALRGFNMELNETSAQKISDVYSELAAITAADVDEISTAMTKTASIASSAGMEFETTAAFLSQIIETTRESAETAGTAMKTVIARFQELKKSPEEIGEVDGEIVDANKIETALRSVSVALRDSSGQFRDLDDVFLDLSSKWDGLDKNTQRYIATIAAGSRQQSRFIAMMSDYKRTTELVAAANNSAGASTRQFEKTQDSLRSKIAKLKNAWNEFTMGILDSDLVKFGVDMLTKFLEIINKITKGLGDGGFLGTLTKIMSVMSIFKMGMKVFEKFKSPMMVFFGEIVKQAGIAGEESGKAYASGVGKAKEAAVQRDKDTGMPEGYTIDKNGRMHNKEGKFVSGLEQDEIQFSQQITAKPQINYKTQTGRALGESAVGQLGMKISGADKLTEWQAAHKLVKENRDKLGKNRKERKANKEQYDNNKKQLAELKTKSNKSEKDIKDIKKLEKATKEYEQTQEHLAQASKKQWDSISSGITAASGALMGISVGFGMVGSALESAGMEEGAEVFNKTGQVFATTSAILGIIPPILSVIQALFPGVGASSAAAGATATVAGTTASAAWSIVGIIVLAVVAAIAVALIAIIAIMALVNRNSPEKKLEETQEAAQNAAEAADEAAKAYEKLADALDELDGKYKTIDELTRGTKEWNKAMLEINSSVLDLIDEYPELAEMVENDDGLLRLDVDSEEVQAVLQQASARKITSKNASVMANLAVAQAEDEVQYSKISNQSKVVYINPNTSNSYAAQQYAEQRNKELNISSEEDVKDRTDEIARAMASGKVGTTFDDLKQYMKKLEMTGPAAEQMAQELWKNKDELRKYGETLNATEAQQIAAYDSIASSAQSLASTLDMTAEQIQQSSVLVDGDLSKQYYDEKMSEMENLTTDDSDSGLDSNEEVKAAIKETYGEGAKIDNYGNVTYQKDGQNAEITLTKDQIKSMVATRYATQKSANAIESTDQAISAAASVIGESAINNLYKTGEGKALTKADSDRITETLGGKGFVDDWDNTTSVQKEEYKNDPTKFSQEIQNAWAKIVAEGGADAYGNDIIKFVDDLAEGSKFSQEAFEEAGDAARSFMNAGQAKEWKKKLDAIDDLAQIDASQSNSDFVEKATDALMSQVKTEGIIDPDKQSEIQNRIHITDWTNLEELLKLQIDLTETYGISRKAAIEYTTALAEASYATSSMETTILEFGKFYQVNQKVQASLKKISDLQWEYNRALESGTGSVRQLIEDQLAEYKILQKGYEDRYKASSDNLQKILGQSMDVTRFGGYDLSKYMSINEDGSLNTSVGESGLGVQDLLNILGGNNEAKDAVKELIDSYNTEYDTQQESLQGLKDVIDGIKGLEQATEESYQELRDMAKDAIVNSIQKQIDLQQETLDATREANSLLVGKIQEQIDADRQLEANKKAEENIENMRSQAAYLAMDTSGGNALEAQQLQSQIEQAEEDYRNTLIDQTIQNLQDANAKAEEQRERQIALQQQQLEAYQLSAEFQTHIDEMLDEMITADGNWKNTELGQLMLETFTAGMSSAETVAWGEDLGTKIAQASLKDYKWDRDINSAKTSLETLPVDIQTAIEGGAATKAITTQATNLQGSGFNLTDIGIESKNGAFTSTGGGKVTEEQRSQIQTLSQVTARDQDASNISSLQSSINSKSQRAGDYGETDQAESFTYLSQTEFYKKYTADFADDGKATVQIHGKDEVVESYSDYLRIMNNKSLEGIDNLTALEAFGGSAIPGDHWHIWDWHTGEDFDAEVNGKSDIWVELGNKVDNGNLNNLLNHIYNQTGGGEDKPYVVLYGTDNGAPDVGQGKENKLYLSQGYGQWWRVRDQGADNDDGDYRPTDLLTSGENYINAQTDKKYTKYKFKTGGLADFTGPAWLDGTKSRPEYVLNSAQTERFFSLIDVLEKYDTEDTKKQSGDNYFEIEINVEKLENDYDVEQVANKIRKMIYEDAMYRNVNAINNMR